MPHAADLIVLKPGRDKPVRQHHPWIFSGAIQHIPAACVDGAIVDVAAANGSWLGRGYLNRRSQIQVRLLTWNPNETIDDSFWQRRLTQAIATRQRMGLPEQTTAYRLVNAENDFLPGLVVDRYDQDLVLQSGTLGIERHKARLAQLLLELTGTRSVSERSDMAARQQEGLTEAGGLLAGVQPGPRTLIQEDNLRFVVDLAGGQKTGFYLDQRENRRRAAAYCTGRRVLNAFSYTGAFAVHALAAGAAHVTNLDSSFDALELGEENLRLNGFDPDTQAASLAGDVFHVLRDWRNAPAEETTFDVIILDPPKFVHNHQNLARGLRGYKDINLLALHLLRPGGILVTCSCSGLVGYDLFQKVVFGAATDAGRDVQILARLHQAGDHPVALTFPEGEYLKGLICHVG